MSARAAGLALLVSASLGCASSDASPVSNPDPQTKPKPGPPAFVVGGFSVDVPAVTLAPGEESYPCFIAPLVVSGPSHVVGGGAVTTGLGMHHGNVTSRPKTGDGIRACSDQDSDLSNEGLDIENGGSVLFGSTSQAQGTSWRSFPDGMGFPVRDDQEIVIRLHYLNSSNQPITLAPHYEWDTIDEARVTHLLAPFVWRYAGFDIAAHQPLTVTADCQTAQPMEIVSLMPHMHKLGVGFDASFLGGPHDGQPFVKSSGYDPNGVIVSHNPPIDTTDTTGFSFSCSWDNTTDDEVTEGAEAGEMCMVFGYAYPFEAAVSALAQNGQCAVSAPVLPSGWETRPH